MSAVSAFELDFMPSQVGLSNWIQKAKSAYDAAGRPTYLDAYGELIEGIYLGMPNDVYHALDALSSTGMKTFVDSPAIYERDYLSNVNRIRTVTQKRTFDAGTYGHELCLEPQGFCSRYFRDVLPSEFPDSLQTITQIDAALVKAGLSVSEGKAEKLARLQAAAPSVDFSSLTTIREIEAEMERFGVSKSESKLDKARRLCAANQFVDVFDLLFLENRLKHGTPEQKELNGETVTTYGGKLPVDGMVWDDAHRVQKTVRSHREADAILQNGMPEVTIIAKCPLTQMMLKSKFDWLGFDDTAADVKTTRDTKPSRFLNQIYDLKYHIQEAFYTYVASLAGISILRFSFIAVEYIRADICQPYELDLEDKKAAKLELMDALRRFVVCKSQNKWYGWSNEDCTIVLGKSLRRQNKAA
jgi:exodeoxyribonuclease VIII